MVKPVDGAKPQQVRTQPTVTAKSKAVTASLAQATPDSGFANKKQKLVSISGGFRPVKPSPELLNQPLYSKVTVATAQLTPKAKLPADVGALLEKGARMSPALGGDIRKENVAEAKKDFADAQKAIAAGKYGEAFKALEQVLRKNEDVVGAMGVDGATTSTYAVKAQLEFLSKMEGAGIKADYPPTEKQLVDYFKTLKGDPEGARQAFDDYAHNFHVHPSNVPGADFDVKYTEDKTVKNVTTSVPNDWSEVSNRSPGPGAKYESIGKQLNDCEGFAFMAEKLLGAAGFQLQNHLTVHGSPVGEHAMALFKHPKEKGFTVTSNDGVFHAKDARAAAKEGYIHAVGMRQVLEPNGEPVIDPKTEEPKLEPNLTGKEKYHTGKTMQDSQVSAMNGGSAL